MKNRSNALHPDRQRWNEKYRNKGVKALGGKPSGWLITHEKLLLEQPKGPALDLACGNGRNAMYLAELGFRVDAVDISDVVITWCKEEVEKRALPIYPQQMNLETDPLPKGKYQVIVNFNYLERSIFDVLKDALLPGGLLVFESFIKDHSKFLDHQFNPNFMLDHNELLKAFSDLQILHYREDIVTEKCPRSNKKAVASLVARKAIL